MIRTIAVSVALILLVSGERARADDAPIQVMILGTYHFANPGKDLHNMEADDVTAPRRQKELAELAQKLGAFKPTRIAVEKVVDAADYKVPAYRAFKPADLATDRNERTQIGYRIAREQKHADVFGIDEESATIDYFPYDKVDAYAKAHGGQPRLAAMHAKVEAMTQELSAQQKTHTIAELLVWVNDTARVLAMQRDFQYGLLALGDHKTQPGADLNAMWYLRNAKMFAKLTQIAKPGDRVIVVVGFGHAYWLRHFVETTPGFQLVEPARYLAAKP
jgi:uncharacterized protein DUF5694